MNILILSAGTRNKIVQYFKNAVGSEGTIIATDMSELAPAVYEADKFYKVPRITEEGYIDIIFDICKKENINGVLSLIDPELSGSMSSVGVRFFESRSFLAFIGILMFIRKFTILG